MQDLLLLCVCVKQHTLADTPGKKFKVENARQNTCIPSKLGLLTCIIHIYIYKVFI